MQEPYPQHKPATFFWNIDLQTESLGIFTDDGQTEF